MKRCQYDVVILVKTFPEANVLKLAPHLTNAQEQVAYATRAMPTPHFKDISDIECQLSSVLLTVVRSTAGQNRLYDQACAALRSAPTWSKPAVEPYLEPFTCRVESRRTDRRYLAALLRQLVLKECRNIRPSASRRGQSSRIARRCEGDIYSVTEKPEWGIEIDEEDAAKAPLTEGPLEWRLG